METIESPCEKICILDQPSGLCRGCGRSLIEIERWAVYSVAVGASVLDQLPKRLDAINPRIANTCNR
jgi:predicted Fe-S protein YdhL (DUF1289 family)